MSTTIVSAESVKGKYTVMVAVRGGIIACTNDVGSMELEERASGAFSPDIY